MVLAAKNPDAPRPSVTVDPNPDYITCPACERRFNEDAGKRHIPICKEKAAKKAFTMQKGLVNSPVKDKSEVLKRRTTYKPPSPRKSSRK
jgi:hypothetical protein